MGFGVIVVVILIVLLRSCSGGSPSSPDMRFYKTMVDSNNAMGASSPQSPSEAVSAVGRFAAVLTQYDKSDLSPEFRDWANRYESALYATKEAFQQIEFQSSGAHFQQAMVESLFRGYMGDPLGKMREELQQGNSLQWGLQQRLNQLDRLNAELDGLRGKFEKK